MEIKRIKYCPFCKNNIVAKVEFTDREVIQSCPKCGQELGRAGAFISGLAPAGTNLTMKVEVL